MRLAIARRVGRPRRLARLGGGAAPSGLARLVAGAAVGAALSCGAPQAPAVSEPVAAGPVRIEPVLTPAQRAANAAAYRDWQGKLAGEWAALLQLEQAGRLPPATAAQVRQAHARRAEAERLAHDAPAAVAAMRAAWMAAHDANLANAIVRRVAAGDAAGAIAALGTFDLERARALFGAPAEEIDVVAAFAAGLVAWAQSALASDALAAATERIAAQQARTAAERAAPATTDAIAELAIRALQAIRAADAELAALARVLAGPA
jgi:hypothetical protein